MCLFLTLSVHAAPKEKPYIFISASCLLTVSKHHIAGLTTIFTPVDHSHLCPFDRIEKNKLYLSVTNVQIKTDLKNNRPRTYRPIEYDLQLNASHDGEIYAVGQQRCQEHH